MSYKTIRIEKKGPAAILYLDRPEKLNALSQELIGEVVLAFGELDNDPDVRGVIITGNKKAFSTGADLNDGINQTTVADSFRYLQHQRQLTDVVERSPKPVIAAIDGYCITGGFELALACDIRIASEGATFGITSAKIGGVAGLGGTQRLPRLIGAGRAKELLFTSDFFDAHEADRIGLLNKLVPNGEAVAEAEKMVERFAVRAPMSIWMMKRCVNTGMEIDLQNALNYEGHCTALAFSTEDRTEGWSAFLEKRDAVFKGI